MVHDERRPSLRVGKVPRLAREVVKVVMMDPYSLRDSMSSLLANTLREPGHYCSQLEPVHRLRQMHLITCRKSTHTVFRQALHCPTAAWSGWRAHCMRAPMRHRVAPQLRHGGASRRHSKGARAPSSCARLWTMRCRSTVWWPAIDRPRPRLTSGVTRCRCAR